MGQNFKDTFPAQEPCELTFDQLRSLSDEHLIVHVRNRDGDALGILFDRYHRLILHVALKVLRDVGEAEDVMQNVFMEIYNLAVQFDPARGTAKMWILRHAYHRSINRRRHLLVRNFYATTDISGIEDTLPAPGTDLVASHEAKEVVDQGLLTLTATQRRVLQMAYFESLTMKEIAKRTGESLGNVRHHYYRGLDKLRAYLCEADQASDARLARKETSNAKA